MAAKKKTTKNPTRAKAVKEEVADVRADAARELDKMSDEDVKAQVELIKEKRTHEDEGIGKEALRSEDKSRYAHRDHIPGTRRRDLLALPEYVFDEVSQERRKGFGAEGSRVYHYCWVEGSDLTRFKVMGYRMVPYNGGRADLPSPGLSGTGLFECDISNHIKLGDAYLMFCEMRLYEALSQEDRDAADRLTRLGASNFHNMGYRFGSRTFEEVDGVRQSN